jgi:hypothetical protein
MTTADLLQSLTVELQKIIREGWSMSRHGDSFLVTGPDSPDFVSEVWRIARFIAYDEYVCIERLGAIGKAYRISSRSRQGLTLDVTIRVK